MKPDPVAQQRVAEAQARLTRVQNDAVLRGLVARQRVLEEALVAGARKIRETAFGFGQRTWAPSMSRAKACATSLPASGYDQRWPSARWAFCARYQR